MTDLDAWTDLYRDLHQHPELSFQEERTASLVAEALRGAGFQVETGVGRTGVVGVLRNGDGPTVLVRADMDALPVTERTGLPYTSTVDGVAHACGHDLHVTCLLAACEELAGSPSTWSGTLLAVFQPAEEVGAGAQAMIDDGLYERHGTPTVVLGQHVVPMPAGTIGLHAGASFAAADSLKITLHGAGGHGSSPHAAVDPIVLAAATVLRLQTVVSRETAPSDFAVVTVGRIDGGTKANIIPDSARIEVNVRTYEPRVRTRVLAAIERIVEGEAATSGAPQPPDVDHFESLPAVMNDAAACEATKPALSSTGALVIDPGGVPGSEDVGLFATAAECPCVYWLLGGADPAEFAGLTTIDEIAERVASLPTNHSPFYAPVPSPTIDLGIKALVAAARHWLPAAG
ncbi:amidohydrolase [Aquihabitans sp. McL0605]|uniref:amidohydrolase n=1 Tax=Aquihabitans sp. McL0605 TaxID=3415671 RepID=UPI003CFB9408